VRRREFLRFGSCGLAAVTFGTAGLPIFLRGGRALAAPLSGAVPLTLIEADAEMVDGTLVYSWAFDGPAGPRIPGPLILATEGERVRLEVRNEIPHGGAHGFAVPGVVESGPIPHGETVPVDFTAPAAGTYLYLDPFNAPVNRVMGLHGVLLVVPPPVGHHTPYSRPTPKVQRLFDDLGSPGWSAGRGSAHFPGHPWDPDRTWIWLFHTVDPDKNALLDPEQPGSVSTLAAAQFQEGYLPRYFTLNGKSGFFAAGHHPDDAEHAHHGPLPEYDLQVDIAPFGNVGQPALVRTVNAGLATHSLHPHGNHHYLLAENGTVRDNVWWVDTWTLPPLARKDLLLPFIRPPEIPAPAWPPVDELFPLQYTMHCHVEMSQTAAGGNYPQGAVTHWQIGGDVDPNDAVILVDRAEIRVRSGRLLLEGRCSTPGIVLDLHPGDGSAPAVAEFPVGDDGRWRVQGRALAFLASRTATVMFHEGDRVHTSRTVALRLR
jgi:hypothetical protein